MGKPFYHYGVNVQLSDELSLKFPEMVNGVSIPFMCGVDGKECRKSNYKSVVFVSRNGIDAPVTEIISAFNPEGCATCSRRRK